MILYDFKCAECGEVSEHFAKIATKTVQCDCGGEAVKIITPVRFKLEGVSGHFPSAAMKWDRVHEVGGRQE